MSAPSYRSGRASGSPSAADEQPAIKVAFDLRTDGCLYCLVARVEVGVICQHREGGRPGWTWLCMLPVAAGSTMPKHAATLDKAKDAMRSAVETWCEAAGLCTRPRRPRGEVRAWRGGDNG